MPQPLRRPANLSLDSNLVSQARDLNINLSRAAEEGIERAVKSERERLWRIENAEPIAASNKYVEEHGLPLADYRQF